MRASLVDEIKVGAGEVEVLEGNCLHHLLNVARVKSGQPLKLLDGKGKTALGVVEDISKKRLKVRIEKLESFERSIDRVSIAFAQPKKDALEFCLRASVETGAEKIFILQTERSQSYRPNRDRFQKIIENALEQSNNPFLPDLVILGLNELKLEDFDYCALASLRSTSTPKSLNGKGLLLIGPEGGFTDDEESLIFSSQKSMALQFKGPILRTQTAIPFFMGLLSHANLEA